MTTYQAHDTPAQTDDIDARFPPGHPVHKAIQRVVSDTYSFWALCDSGKCRRAGRCRGEPSRCLDAYMPLLSPAVGEAGDVWLKARCQQLSFEDAMAQYGEQFVTLMRWRQSVENRRGAPGGQRQRTRQ